MIALTRISLCLCEFRRWMKKTNTILEANMRYYLENSKKLMPGGHDDEDTDEEEESDWLEEDGIP